MKFSFYSEIQSRPGKTAAQPDHSQAIRAQELFAHTVMPHFEARAREEVAATS